MELTFWSHVLHRIFLSKIESPDRREIEASLSHCGQSYKHFTLVYYDSKVVLDKKILHNTTLGS